MWRAGGKSGHSRGWAQGCTWLLPLVSLLAISVAAPAAAQTPRMNSLHHEFLPPGVIGQEQLRRHAGMANYFQAVEVIAPEGVEVGVQEAGTFRLAGPAPLLVGMQVGSVYCLKLTKLPNREGVELFPTIEVINRLFPPEGTKTRFPVPVEITEEDIAQAMAGLFVTRVVYLEDPDQAFPRADDPQHPRTQDVAPSQDPLHVADRLGRPMAILRLGSRVPEGSEVLGTAAASPPIQIYPVPKIKVPNRDVRDAIEREGTDIPRGPELGEPATNTATPARN